jgi:hypothetical protein
VEIKAGREKKERKEEWFTRAKSKPFYQHVLHVEIYRVEMIRMKLRKGMIRCLRPLHMLPKCNNLYHEPTTFPNFSFPFKRVLELTSFNFISQALTILNQRNIFSILSINWMLISFLTPWKSDAKLAEANHQIHSWIKQI